MKNFEELKIKKERLKEEIKEIESVMSFENPRKSLGVITDGLTEKYLGGFIDSGITQNVYSIAERLVLPSLRINSARLLKNMITKKVKPSLGKVLLGIGTVVLATVIIRRAKKELDNYQQKETAKSLSKLI